MRHCRSLFDSVYRAKPCKKRRKAQQQKLRPASWFQLAKSHSTTLWSVRSSKASKRWCPNLISLGKFEVRAVAYGAICPILWPVMSTGMPSSSCPPLFLQFSAATAGLKPATTRCVSAQQTANRDHAAIGQVAIDAAIAKIRVSHVCAFRCSFCTEEFVDSP